MSLPRPNLQGSFFDTSHIASRLFDDDNSFAVFQKKILPLLRDARSTLEAMYDANNGRPAIEPVTLLGVTLLQFMERLPDREAVDAVRFHLGWKHALDLEIDDKGFHATSLVVFRNRLLEHEASRLLFDTILSGLRSVGLVKSGARARMDSTHVVGMVSRMSRLQVVREAIRLALVELESKKAETDAKWWSLLWERYVDSEQGWKLSDTEMKKRHIAAGEDALLLIRWFQETNVESEALKLLRRVFDEQYEKTRSEKAPVASKTKVPSGAVMNPHDPEAEGAAKGRDERSRWVGFKTQVVETVEHETPKGKGEPTEQFITEIATTLATASDFEGMEKSLEALEASGMSRPAELYVDAGYVSAETLAEAKNESRKLIGPARPSPTPNGVLDADGFTVSIVERKAVCPAGMVSTQCAHINDEHQGREYYRFEWGAECDACPLRAECTKSRTGRRILTVSPHHEHLQERRREMKTPEFAERYKKRAGVEATISELVRRYGLRRTRYRGRKKTELCNLIIGAACNVRRWIRLELQKLENQAPTPAIAGL